MKEPMKTEEVDPITLSVLQNGLMQVCNEMDLAFVRSAFSPVIAEALDRSDGIYHRTSGELIASPRNAGPRQAARSPPRKAVNCPSQYASIPDRGAGALQSMGFLPATGRRCSSASTMPLPAASSS